MGQGPRQRDVPVDVQEAVLAFAERGLGKTAPAGLVRRPEVREQPFHFADRRRQIGLRMIAADVGADTVDSGVADLGTDIVENDGCNLGRRQDAQAHGQQAAHGYAQDYDPVKVGGGHQVEQVVGIDFGPVVAPVGIVVGAAAAPVVGAHHAARTGEPFGEASEVLGVAGQAAETENRPAFR
jgi:hypothetical protein